MFRNYINYRIETYNFMSPYAVPYILHIHQIPLLDDLFASELAPKKLDTPAICTKI